MEYPSIVVTMVGGESPLKGFGLKVDALIKRRNLSRQEVKEMMRQVLFHEQPDIPSGAFLAALTAKGPTAEEVAGCWEAVYEYDTPKVEIPGMKLVENSGTGMDDLKTFNVSTASSIVAASCGIPVVKHAARAITSKCGAIDVAEALGIDVDCPVECVKKSIERCNIGIFNGMNPALHPGLARILKDIRFGSVLNIAASLANPAMPRIGLRGIYSRNLLLPVAEVMREIGYKRALVVSGTSSRTGKSVDEISIIGETYVAELFDDGTISTYELAPKDVGVCASVDESEILASSDPKGEARALIRALSGEDRPKAAMTAANAGALIYLSGKSDSIADGAAVAFEAIGSGKAIEKLEEWIKAQNRDPERGIRIFESVAETKSATFNPLLGFLI
ncbi:MAG: Pyrimidine-nucleoside phosphorylase [Candidatus Methanosuratincola subterraneus]|uniref:Anthranilate phosphoribosyltransferase n=1 Tax=Methanosuratincola subterraneus TaxID=2593994 RepID=A0A444L9L3_METS7|nr:MAG: Pyrimidine-nucleoside phosphorylase [Candidatus Methanosuratincola subterraneus]